ncbi:AAI domain-containing protein [Psidium guajava]|nr:AAI domain-containing protein [Psidium guajava]
MVTSSGSSSWWKIRRRTMEINSADSGSRYVLDVAALLRSKLAKE